MAESLGGSNHIAPEGQQTFKHDNACSSGLNTVEKVQRGKYDVFYAGNDNGNNGGGEKSEQNGAWTTVICTICKREISKSWVVGQHANLVSHSTCDNKSCQDAFMKQFFG